MRNGSTVSRLRTVLAACVVLVPAALPPLGSALAQTPPGLAAANLAPAMAQYRRALEEYTKARQSFEAISGAYWTSISEKRHARNAKRANGEPLSIEDYVLEQPPVYTGPPRPRDPSKPEASPHRVNVPLVADFLVAAQQEFKFSPLLPASDGEFKRAYAKTALAAGLTRDQIVRIYGFEATGNGNYDVEAGLEYHKGARAITTALGYNQLLATNSVEIVAEDGERFIKKLRSDAAALPDAQKISLFAKTDILRKMVAFCKTVPDAWDRHEILAGTAKGLAVHALNLDLDLGPMLQTQKLLDSVLFARRKGVTVTLRAAELEMMNLTGDGNGFDMVTMPQPWRDRVPTANFFRQSGYQDNPVAQRNNVVAKLLAATDARMDEEVKKPGAKELAAALR
jgi:hypothetical protein